MLYTITDIPTTDIVGPDNRQITRYVAFLQEDGSVQLLTTEPDPSDAAEFNLAINPTKALGSVLKRYRSIYYSLQSTCYATVGLRYAWAYYIKNVL